jgi:hypothetical protein
LHDGAASMDCKRTATPRRRAVAGVVAALAASSYSSSAGADPLRLRGDALAEAQSPSPTGLIVVQGEDTVRPWVSAEALVWAGAKPGVTADVLVLTARLREPHGFGEMRVGRFILATGAILPVQLDGADAILRAPWGSSVETFGGMPVVPRFGARAYDWLAGARVAQSLAARATVGLSYIERRTYGDISDDEVGADFAAAPVRWFDLAAHGSYDLTSPGISEARASAAARIPDFRFELFASQRSPSRLLPATSLFSVLGDFPSQMVGGTMRWNAAPRLDLLASGAGQSVGASLGGNGWVRAALKLDDHGDGNVGLELRRQDVSTAQWTGIRAIGAFPLGHGFRYSTELELAAPDHPDGRGVVWPWGLLALAWRSHTGWEVAGALEASSTPVHRYESDALLRVSRVLEIK